MSHEIRDKVSLQLARRVAEGLSRHPEWVELAKSNLARWSRQNKDAPGLIACYQEWQAILERPLEDIRAELTAETDRGQRLRQNTPFAGALSPQEVWRIKGMAHEAPAT